MTSVDLLVELLLTSQAPSKILVRFLHELRGQPRPSIIHSSCDRTIRSHLVLLKLDELGFANWDLNFVFFKCGGVFWHETRSSRGFQPLELFWEDLRASKKFLGEPQGFGA